MMNKSPYIMGQLMHFKCMELTKWNRWAFIEQLYRFIGDACISMKAPKGELYLQSVVVYINYKTAKFYHKK